MQCSACPFTVTEIELLVCVICKNNYHYKCVNITSAEYREQQVQLKREWRCPSCNNVTTRRKGADHTPVRALNQFRPNIVRDMLSESQQADMSCDTSLLDLENDSFALGNRVAAQSHDGGGVENSIPYSAFAALLQLKFAEFRTELNSNFSTKIDSLRSEVKSLTLEIKGLQHNINCVNEKVKVLELENVDLKSKLANGGTNQSPDIQALQESVTRLETELNDRDQAALSNDLEISGIPEFNDESAVHIVMATATKIGVQLQECDIVSAERVGPVRDAARTAGTEPARPRPLVVRLARRAVRDALLKAARVRRGATTEGLGLPDHTVSKIYVHDRLTRKNRVLLGKARERGRSEQWRFTWSKDGRIYVRKSESSKVYRIRTDSDLDRVFSTPSNNPVV